MQPAVPGNLSYSFLSLNASIRTEIRQVSISTESQMQFPAVSVQFTLVSIDKVIR